LTVSCAYTLADGHKGSASVLFNVNGPHNVVVTPDHIEIQLTYNPGGAIFNGQERGWWSMLGNTKLGVQHDTGITLNSYLQAPQDSSASYKWLQFVTHDVSSRGGKRSYIACYLEGDVFMAKDGPPKDSPGQVLRSNEKEDTRDFTTRSYLLWQPNSADSIPVSLGYLTWSNSSHAVYTGGKSSGVWELRSAPDPVIEAFQESHDLPQRSPKRCP